MNTPSFPITSQPPAIASEPLKYVPHAGFEDWAGNQRLEAAVLGPMPETPEGNGESQAPSGVPPYLASLYDTPLLTREQETHLFRKLNYLKYKANLLRQALATTNSATTVEIELEGLLGEIVATKNQIICANLRLVVSIAKRQFGTVQNFFELISDGNLALLRAVEGFDFSLGNRFSTYATYVIVRNYARSIPEDLRWRSRYRTDHAGLFATIVDGRSDAQEMEAAQGRREILVDGILRRLNAREREIISCRFGLSRSQERLTLKQIGNRFGITKERVRQLECRALEKLRKALGQELNFRSVLEPTELHDGSISSNGW
jgi:RNA polymerase sigma factor (sigma-70 family)